MTAEIWSNVVRGVALGDAWGDPNEFRSIDSLVRDDPMGPKMPQELNITDDTQMTLYLASALDDSWGADMATVQKAIIDAFMAYYHDSDTPSRAPGITVMGSLRGIAGGQKWQHATNKTSDGSGTVMRTSPTAFLPEDRWVGVTAFAAAVTHGSATGVAAAILNAALLREAMAGKVKAGELLGHAWRMADKAEELGLLDVGEWLDGYQVDLTKGFEFLSRMLFEARTVLRTLQVDPWAKSSDPSLQPGLWKNPTTGGGWRAPTTLGIALLAIDMLPEDPWLALRRSVTTDGDSDTIGAVAGGLMGALYANLTTQQTFTEAWNDDLRDRFEPRYVRWIENEADNYPFEAPVKKVAGKK